MSSGIASWRSSAPGGTRSTSPRCTRSRPSSASRGDVVFTGGVPLEETVRFYRAADVFVYPSLNETFGLPILEAMACGCPVVTSDTSAMPETAGGAAVLSDPKDPASIARAIVEAAGPDRDRLRDAGPARAGQFTWGATAAAHPRRVPRGRRAPTASAEMKILVTGGAGFIGSHTCDRLLAARTRGRGPRRADPAGTPERAARVPEPGRRLLPGRHPQPGPAREPAPSRRRRLPLRRLPGLPARLLAVLRRERGLDRPALRDHRGRAPRSRPGRGGVVAVGDG